MLLCLSIYACTIQRRKKSPKPKLHKTEEIIIIRVLHLHYLRKVNGGCKFLQVPNADRQQHFHPSNSMEMIFLHNVEGIFQKGIQQSIPVIENPAKSLRSPLPFVAPLFSLLDKQQIIVRRNSWFIGRHNGQSNPQMALR